jgi:hypothetical protein
MDKYFYYGVGNEFNWTDAEFQIVLSDHLELLDILCYLANTLFEKKIKDEPYKYYSETLAFKYNYHALNLNSLLKGTRQISKIFNFDQIVYDMSSAYIIQRSLLEAYLTFYYLYVQPVTDSESRCKWLVYQIAGLNSRQDFKSDYIDYKLKIETEKDIINKCTEELKCNEYFKSLPESKRKEILKAKPAKIIGWQQLFKTSDIKSELFLKAWRLYSNYAHSEYLSLIQVREYRQGAPEFISAIQSTAFTSLILTSIFITNFRKLYKEVDDNFSTLNRDQLDCVNLLDSIGRESANKLI